ncbi:fibronectin type III domain-containing protein [Actinoplanes sp. NPDC051411]|uniref:fibronectin type III domain-containing protein n=1 Tax=Actinoplanes sp. NPDC051411 TaxID=3155522 RepID=UPI00342758E5
MAPPLAELTAQAQTLTSAGDLAGARRVLATVLHSEPAPDPGRATPDLALAAALHARILIALGDPHAARMWAGYAHAAEERLHGPHDERTMAAAATHAAVLQRVGHYGRAVQVYHQLLGDLTEVEGPDSPRVLAAEADLATAEHSAGHCSAARSRLAAAWRRHRAAFGDAAPAGIKMLARLGSMERECGRLRESGEHFAMAQELCARYLPADHPLVAQVTRLATAPPSGRHTCGRVAQSAGPQDRSATQQRPSRAQPHDPPGTQPFRAQPHDPTTTQPFRAQPHDPTTTRPIPGEPQESPAARQGPFPGPLQDPATAQTGPYPGQPQGPATARTGPHPEQAQDRPAGRRRPFGRRPSAGSQDAPTVQQQPFPRRPTVPGPDEFPPDDPGGAPDNRPTDPNGSIYQQPLYLADVHQVPGDLTGRHARADTPPPLPGQRAPEYGPDGRPQPVGTAATGTRTLPPNSERLLPVRKEKPDPSRSRQPFILAAVLVGGVAAAAAVVLLTLPDADGAVGPSAPVTTPPASAATTSPAPAASATSPVPPADPGAPTAVKLRDNRDSVMLSWHYPKGAEGPVLISGGRSGQPQRAFQQLPAGTDNYVVYGLNDAQNYCFTIAVAYATNHIADSQPVCTKR